MAFNERNLDDYVDVAERIQEFYERYPEGSLQPANPASPWEFATAQGYDKNGEQAAQTFVVYVAAAYRTPEDPRPGIGVAWEVWPGRTPYTRGSEVMNAETSAWGRALAALGIATKKGVRSAQEMAAREAEQQWAGWSGPEPASEDCRDGSHCGPCSGCRCFCHQGWPVNKDGTLSLSKMSDEQRREAGVMTRAEAKEHTALGGGHPNERKTPAAERGKVSRLRPESPPEDPWSGPVSGAPTRTSPGSAPATAAGSDAPLEDRPGSIGPRQRSAIMAKLGTLPRDERIGHLVALVGREVASTNDLSFTEAARVLAELGAAK